ncbi:hypothetical protein PQX77_000861 [Marasmius sp. AFHP31]|nr:hypothetical protein PQX77_000861 [Marasmius sp. AFHP31]
MRPRHPWPQLSHGPLSPHNHHHLDHPTLVAGAVVEDIIRVFGDIVGFTSDPRAVVDIPFKPNSIQFLGIPLKRSLDSQRPRVFMSTSAERASKRARRLINDIADVSSDEDDEQSTIDEEPDDNGEEGENLSLNALDMFAQHIHDDPLNFSQPGKEMGVVLELMQPCIKDSEYANLIRSAFWNGRPGSVYLETQGLSVHLTAVLKGSNGFIRSWGGQLEATVLNHEEIIPALATTSLHWQNCTSGKWVKITLGPYKGDVGLILE